MNREESGYKYIGLINPTVKELTKKLNKGWEIVSSEGTFPCIGYKSYKKIVYLKRKKKVTKNDF